MRTRVVASVLALAVSPMWAGCGEQAEPLAVLQVCVGEREGLPDEAEVLVLQDGEEVAGSSGTTPGQFDLGVPPGRYQVYVDGEQLAEGEVAARQSVGLSVGEGCPIVP